jgi:hypothetical protein
MSGSAIGAVTSCRPSSPMRARAVRGCKEELERAQADEEAAYQANLAWRAA